MTGLQHTIEEAQRRVFLQRLKDWANSHPDAMVPSGNVGQELGLPYERTLRIVGELHERGWLHRQDELSPPHGPLVHLTARGLSALTARAA